MLPYAYVEYILARHAAPCLAGIKPANLVSFSSADVQWCNTYNTLLNTYGIHFIPLCVCGNRSQILIYRKSLLSRFFFQHEVMNALRYFGYKPDQGLTGCIEQLKERMSALSGIPAGRCKEIFPHEIGLFLGYPVEDVFQYMKTGGRNCLFCGYWKVYSNPEQARQLFHQYTECKERFALHIKNGMSISDIIHAA